MGCKHKQSYARLAFEQEAYRNETDENYLDNRKWFAWVKYLKHKNKTALKVGKETIEI